MIWRIQVEPQMRTILCMLLCCQSWSHRGFSQWAWGCCRRGLGKAPQHKYGWWKCKSWHPIQRVDLNGGLVGRREGTLSMLTSSVETVNGMGVRENSIWQNNNKQNIGTIVTKRIQTFSYLCLNSCIDGYHQQWPWPRKYHIESSSSKIKDEDISGVANDLLNFVESIINGSSSVFVDDTEDVHARDSGSSILGPLMLWVIKVQHRDGDDGIVDEGAKICLSGLLHLEEDHGGNFFRRLKRSWLTKKVDGTQGALTLTNALSGTWCRCKAFHLCWRPWRGSVWYQTALQHHSIHGWWDTSHQRDSILVWRGRT